LIVLRTGVLFCRFSVEGRVPKSKKLAGEVCVRELVWGLSYVKRERHVPHLSSSVFFDLCTHQKKPNKL
jgi:hypothetical protein